MNPAEAGGFEKAISLVRGFEKAAFTSLEDRQVFWMVRVRLEAYYRREYLGASSNGRTSVLQPENEGSIPSAVHQKRKPSAREDGLPPIHDLGCLAVIDTIVTGPRGQPPCVCPPRELTLEEINDMFPADESNMDRERRFMDRVIADFKKPRIPPSPNTDAERRNMDRVIRGWEERRILEESR